LLFRRIWLRVIPPKSRDTLSRAKSLHQAAMGHSH
jgi:hypothetical protein